jgi:hypothetical protein
MDSQRKREYDFAKADREAVRSLLEQCDDAEDAMTRWGLEARLKEVEENIYRIEADERAKRQTANHTYVSRLREMASGVFQPVTGVFAGAALSVISIVIVLVILRIFFGP